MSKINKMKEVIFLEKERIVDDSSKLKINEKIILMKIEIDKDMENEISKEKNCFK